MVPAKNHLKIFEEDPPEAGGPQLHDWADFAELLEAFEQATGWSLQYVDDSKPNRPSDLTWSAPVTPGVGTTLGHFRLDRVGSAGAASQGAVARQVARRLASALATLMGDKARTQHALWEREAELAAGVPLVPHPDEKRHLAARLEAVLKGGVQAVGCQAAALYLLDDATTQLKLRSCWGLPRTRLADPPRPLRGAVADLEAMLGHAVVLEDIALENHWNAPEDFPSALCVPVSTPTSILGTLWVFSATRRDFTDHQTGILEVVAGRLAAELEREMLLVESSKGVKLQRQLTAAELLQQNQLPTVAPLVNGWDVAGWTAQANALGGDFYDWFGLPDGAVFLAVGDAMDQGVEAALVAGSVRAALRSLAQHHKDPGELLSGVGRSIWSGSVGDQLASLFCASARCGDSCLRYACAGQMGIVLLQAGTWKPLSRPSPRLMENPETKYESGKCTVRSGEALLVFTDGVRDAPGIQGRKLGEAGVAEPLADNLALSAQELVLFARARLEAHALRPPQDDRTVLVIKRTDA